jgi:hypothetical protein
MVATVCRNISEVGLESEVKGHLWCRMFVISKASEVVRFEILTVVFLDSQVFWDVTCYCWAQNS